MNKTSKPPNQGVGMSIDETADKIIEQLDVIARDADWELGYKLPTDDPLSMPQMREVVTAELLAAIQAERDRNIAIIESKMHSSPKRRDIVEAINEVMAMTSDGAEQAWNAFNEAIKGESGE